MTVRPGPQGATRVTPPPPLSHDLDQGIAAGERLHHVGEHGGEPAQRLAAARVAEADPDDARSLLFQNSPRGEILVLGQDDGVGRFGVAPDGAVVGTLQPAVRDMLGRMSLA